jgi:ABC-type cobalt transport system substrate-binding protein
MLDKKTDNLVIAFLIVLFAIGNYVILNTQNSFGGADNIAHYFAAHYGWQYPRLLFDHWSKPVFTILISPFAQLGINGVRIYNLLLGLAGGFFAYKTAKIIGVEPSITALIFTILSPIYFILMFTSLTEISFAFFLILGVYLFFKNKFLWSAIVISFLPIIRTEGIILLPLFALAYGLKKSYLSILFLSFGFFLISILGYPFYNNFFWLITEMPYGGNNIYGSGEWMHFINSTKNIQGYIVLILFILGLIITLWKYVKKGVLNFKNDFFILLLIFAPFVLYYSAHTYVWAMGKGGSLGLIRVIGAVIPLSAIGASISFDKIHSFLSKYNKYLSSFIIVLIAVIMFSQAKHIYKWGFYPTNREKLMNQTAEYIKNNKLDRNHLVYYDVNLLYELKRDPYDNSKTSWMIKNRERPSMPFPDSTIIVWDSHFGNNEGQMPLQNLTNDSKLVLLKKIAPETPTTTLGGYNYEIYIFQKINLRNKEKLRHFYQDFNNKERIADEDSICIAVNKNKEYVDGLTTNTSDICDKYTEFDIEVSFDINNKTDNPKDLIFVVSIENGEIYFYKPLDFSSSIKSKEKWEHLDFQLHNIGISPGVEVLKIYIWNKGKNEFLIDNYKVDFKEANQK